MSGSTLAMAPAVESTNNSPFHRSHSTPDLLLLDALPKQPPPRSAHAFNHRHTISTAATASPTASAATAATALLASASAPNLGNARSSSFSTTDLALKSLPSLPAFDVPLFDFDLDIDAELDFSFRKNKKSTKKEKRTSDPPRRIWEEFIRDENSSLAGSFASETGTENEPIFRRPFTSAGLSPTINSTEDTAQIKQSSHAASYSSTKLDDSEKFESSGGVDRLSRRRALIDRPLSWISTSRSTPDFHELLIQEREKEARRAAAAAAVAALQLDKHDRRIDAAAAATATVDPAAAPTLLTSSERMVERQRTASASFVEFARRSWISRSPSPSPPTPNARRVPKKDDDSARFGGKLTRKRPVSTVVLVENNSTSDSANPRVGDNLAEDSTHGRSDSSNSNVSSNDSNSTIGPTTKADGAADGATIATSATTIVASTTSTSRAFSRASEYITRIKQRPQSMFVKTAVVTTTTTNFSDFDGDQDSDDDSEKEKDGEKAGSGKHTQMASITLNLSVDLLTPETADKPAERSSLLLPTEPSHARNSSSRRSSSDGSSADGSANGSALLPASEAESLTTADNSNHNSPMTHPTSRDPLWVAFKDLETNFYKFLSKTTTAQRMVTVRATLIPFLRRYAVDSSNRNTKLLSPEDVERRTSIFNRWWTGLLELLDGPSQWQGSSQGQGRLFGGGTFFPTSTTTNGNFQPVAGVDRPVVLEAVSLIMSRPEWRLLTPVFRSFAERSPGERVRARANTTDSPPLDDSSFLVEESAEHNVRTMFVNNLLAQLIFVVDRMAMRQAPLSVVNFGGKACAYAFFFVPGVADILIRLWGLEKNIELVRRAADAFGLPRRSRGESEDLVALFPPCVGPLGWSSVSTMHAKLRRPPNMSLLPPAYVAACSRSPWFAPCWLSRWRGADTDLLFIFCKYYHLLADEFMPSSLQLPLVEKARAPGFVLLHAQLLHIFDNTIHRQAAMEAAMMVAGAPIGEGGLSLWMQQQQQQQSSLMSSSDDAFIPSLMFQPNHNLFREMDENRIVALLRDFLGSDESAAGARDTFAESAMILLRAATLRTSQYDHGACYILCDFLHEILLTFDNYYGYSNSGASRSATAPPSPVDYIDWTFWLDVCKMMLESNNTMSEIRVLAFVYSTWDIVAADPARKEELCVRWLLTEDVFDKFFNNWCPMVRAYYMRLLCWRMCRDSGSSNELDAKIFLLVSQRLKTVWSHYLWLKQKADNEGSLQPSTAPSLPQPGKRFMIIRTEVNVPQLGLLANNNGNAGSFGNNRTPTSFDALASSVNGINPSSGASYRGDTNNGPSIPASADEKKAAESSAKKKWSLLGKVLNLAAKTPSDEEFEQMRRETAAARVTSGPSTPLPPPKSARLGSPSSDSDSSTGSTPIFDASHFVFKFVLHNIPWQSADGGQGGIILPPAYRERVLTRPRLPAPAQARVSARIAASGKRSESPPPPAAGLPPITRRVSGLSTGGLINEARNANPADSVPLEDASSLRSGDSRASMNFDSGSVSSRTSFGYHRDSSPFASSGEWERGRSSGAFDRSGSPEDDFDRERERERIVVQPVEPKGHTALLRAKYAGRALAEWSLVVNECNSFVDRRRDEGIYGLKDVEVPSLGVEGLRRVG